MVDSNSVGCAGTLFLLCDLCGSNMVELKKLGEGTFGEAFKGSGNVFKIVPMDGNFQVNGEHQKVEH